MLKTVSSMGGGESSNVFATDITVNGLTVGKGDGNVTTNTAFGVDALGSPAITANNINNVAIGYNALNDVDTGVATITVTNGGSGYNDDGNDNFTYSATCTFVSGAPATVYPTVTLTVVGGVITSAVVTNKGYGFTVGSLTTMTVPDYFGYGGSGAVLNVGTYAVSSNNTAVGYNAGTSNRAGNNSVYIGSNANGTGTNEIVIGSTSGHGDNTVGIGSGTTTNTYLNGTVNVNGLRCEDGSFYWNVADAPGSFNIDTIGSFSGSIFIGGILGTNSITLGRSTQAQIINISSATTTAINKTINIGRGATSSSTIVNIGTISNGSNTITLGGGNGTNSINMGGGSGNGTVNINNNTGSTAVTNIATGATSSPTTKTVNIGTGAVSGTTNIAIGATAGTSTTTINGLLKQQTYLVENLPTGSTGVRSFVTNANAPVFGANVVGGGSVGVPVYHDGTSWKVG